MDDKDIITLMFLSKSDAYLAMRLFKVKGYGKNKIKRLVYKELKHTYVEGWEHASGLALNCIINDRCKYISCTILPLKLSATYSKSDVWKHLKIKFNKIR